MARWFVCHSFTYNVRKNKIVLQVLLILHQKNLFTDDSSELLGFCFKTCGVLPQNLRSFFQAPYYFFGKRYCFGWQNSIFYIVGDVVSLGKTVSFEVWKHIFWRNFFLFFLKSFVTWHLMFHFSLIFSVFCLFYFVLTRHQFDTNLTRIWHWFVTISCFRASKAVCYAALSLPYISADSSIL